MSTMVITRSLSCHGKNLPWCIPCVQIRLPILPGLCKKQPSRLPAEDAVYPSHQLAGTRNLSYLFTVKQGGEVIGST